MIRVISDTKHPVKVWASDLEQMAEDQIRKVASLPFIHRHVAVMPDAHGGRGSTIGTVIATKGAIIPAAVGVDIGCGMAAVKLHFKVDVLEKLPELRHSIERAIPTGFNSRKEAVATEVELGTQIGDFSHLKLGRNDTQRMLHQVGTLGGGNHFIEICRDQEDTCWVVLHSGSRYIGKSIADRHISKAKDLMKAYFIDLPDPDLAYLVQHTEEFNDYIRDLQWAQRYAMLNRQIMMHDVLKQIFRHVFSADHVIAALPFAVNCHHNYTAIEHHFGQNIFVTRKGAVSAKKDEWGIIPGSMGNKSYIVQGLGSEDSFHSCAHGAGRRMSRTRARASYNLEDLAAQTAGVECRKDNAVLDEIPASYKDIDEVMANQADLVVPRFELKQIICIKGG